MFSELPDVQRLQYNFALNWKCLEITMYCLLVRATSFLVNSVSHVLVTWCHMCWSHGVTCAGHMMPHDGLCFPTVLPSCRWMQGKEKTQRTDVHYRSMKGKATSTGGLSTGNA